MEANADMMDNFDLHPVTKEINDGPNATNKSNTLSGGYGNLFSFIGFHRSGGNPTQVIRDMLSVANIKRVRVHAATSRTIFCQANSSLPNLETIYQQTPLPWSAGSWAEGIEKGIDGFGNYIYTRWFHSRSGKAAQVGHSLRGTSFKPTTYLSQIYREFERRIQKI